MEPECPHETVTFGWDSPVERASGVTQAERFLKRLCDKTFLSLWSHAGIYRDQGNAGGGHGKEVCDLLVVFEDHVIIFSDKNCKFPDTGNTAVDWCRWFRKAVEESSEQVYGAERWIKENPGRLFIDRQCSHRFPITLPAPDVAKYHRVVVAHNASHRCCRELGGSGSLMMIPAIVGEQHRTAVWERFPPFAIGQMNPTKGYIHVFDDTTLNIVMRARDTITDFVEYLTKKEQLIENGRLVWAAGEEDLLAYYLKNINSQRQHDFVLPGNAHALAISEGEWITFSTDPHRLAQLHEDERSYLWDHLIEKFTHHFLNRTSEFCSDNSYEAQERVLRLFAKESRYRRRMLSSAFLGLVEKGLTHDRATRIVAPIKPDDPYYVFLTLKATRDITNAEYRKRRRKLLGALCHVAKLKYPQAQEIAGIATEPGTENPFRSEDALYFDGRHWTDEDQRDAEKLQKETGLLTALIETNYHFEEYPHLTQYRQERKRQATSLRNSPCPCGSGLKFKRCCDRQGRGVASDSGLEL